MKRLTWIALILCLALLAGCGILDDSKPDATPEGSAPSSSAPKPAESEQPSGVVPEPPDLADRKPVESREPVNTEPVPVESQQPQETPEPSVTPEPSPTPTPDVQIVVGGREEVDAEFCGEWFARKADSSGELRALELTLGKDGAVYFSYGVPYGKVLEVFEGSWWEDGGILSLELYGGPIGDNGNYDYENCRYLDVSFRWEEQGIALICEHMSGNPLIPGTSGEWFTFRPFDSFLLSGTWYAESGEYCLQLRENGGCLYSVTDKNGTLLAEYDGWWNYTDGQIMLSMDMCGGAEYDMGRRGSLAGTYREEHNDQSEMRLTRVSGSALTPAMEDGGTETFEKQ